MYLESWDVNLAKKVLEVKDPEHYYVLSDERAYELYEKHRHWYDKAYIAERWSKIPTVYGDVVYKPRVNLYGMGHECTYPNLDKMIIQKKVEGRHLSIDWCINPKPKISDELIWERYSVFECIKDPETNSFISFERLPKLDSWEVYDVADRVVKELIKEGYKGRFINMEFIGPYLIEVHLRPSVQFMDIDGGLIKFGLLGGDLPEAHEAYSCVYRFNKDKRLTSFVMPERIPPEITSFHVCCELGKCLSEYIQDANSYRYLVINGIDKVSINEFKNTLDWHMIWRNP